MKNIYLTISVILFLVIVTVLSCFSIYKGFAVATPLSQNSRLAATNLNQQAIIDDIMLSFKNYSIPVQSIKIESDKRWNPPFVVSCNLQSSSQDGDIAASDPIFLNIVGHEINWAKEKGLKVGAIHEIVLNTAGKTIINEFQATNELNEIASGFNQPSTKDNNAVNSLLSNIQFQGVVLDDINITLTDDGQHRAVFNLRTSSITIMNTDFAKVVKNIRTVIVDLNQNQGSQIAIYEIRILDEKGNPLLNYSSDLKFGSSCWWQSESLGKLDLK